MKTAVAQMIEKIEGEQLYQYSYEEILEMLEDAKIVQDTQIKIAYLHGGMAVLQKTDVNSDEYFTNEYEKQ